MSLITRIKEYREKEGMKQSELAELVSARRETIVHLENGRYNPSLKLAMEIADVFDATVEDLFEFTEITARKKGDYSMKQIIFKGYQETGITDENGNIILTFQKSKTVPTHARYTVFNFAQEKIGTIEKTRNTFQPGNLPQIQVKVGQEQVILRRELIDLADGFCVVGKDISILGDWCGPKLQIAHKEAILASVEIQENGEDRTYTTTFNDGFYTEFVLSILFAVDWLVHGRNVY